MNEQGEHAAMLAAAQLLDVDPACAQLVSASSRLIWRLPAPALALTISRPGTKTLDDVTAETTAMRAASAAGVRTPALRAGPVAVPGDSWAFATDWIDGRRPTSTDWPAIAAAAARFADTPTAGLHLLAWPDGLNDQRVVEVLGPELHADLTARSTAAEQAFRELVDQGSPVLAHTDIQPANALCDNSGAWLIDMEYASLAPREWDPAKLVILASRFGDPADAVPLLAAWSGLDGVRLRRCVAVHETLLAVWLARMAPYGPPGAGREVRRRASSLATPGAPWFHLS